MRDKIFGGVSRGTAPLVAAAVVWCCLVSSAGALPHGRAYEMVSPVYKGGYGALRIEAVAPDGGSVAFYSPGAFAKAPSGPELFDYVSRRGEHAWLTAPFMLPATTAQYVEDRDVSSTLDSTLALGKPGPNKEIAFQQGLEEDVWLHSSVSADTGEEWTSAGLSLEGLDKVPITTIYSGASRDFCHVFLDAASTPMLSEVLEAVHPNASIYELDRGCDGGSPALRLVGLNNSHTLANPACRVSLGSNVLQESGTATEIQSSQFNTVADDGSIVFFETGIGPACARHQVFARLAGSRTLELSRTLEVAEFGGCVGEVGGTPGEVPCAGASVRASANFVGASEDGSRIFFTTKQPLLGSDSTNNLYMATIGCPAGESQCGVAEMQVTELVQVSTDPNVGGSAEVLGAVRVAADGSRAYFVADGDLLSPGEKAQLESEKRPVPRAGADNLYVYNATGNLSFVADLCSGPTLSGSFEDQQCPGSVEATEGGKNDANLWNKGEAQVNGCVLAEPACEPGRFLVFSTYARLTSSDTDDTKDVYRYDANSGALVRVSGGEDGYHADGNCPDGGSHGGCDATIAESFWGESVRRQYEMGNRAISDDGSRIVFTTAEPLSPSAANGLPNVYEWHEAPGQSAGAVSLISSGIGEPVEDVVIAPRGEDIFFVTTEGLVAQDTDGAPDVYDARTNGGFPPTQAPVEPCGGDSCQGPLTNPAPLLIPGSVVQAPSGNLAPPTHVTAPAKKQKRGSKASSKKKAKARRAKRVSRRGRVRGRGRARR